MRVGNYNVKIATGYVPTWILKMMACCSKQAQGVLRFYDRIYNLDNSRSREILGLEYKEDMGKVVGDCAESIIKSGTVKINKM